MGIGSIKNRNQVMLCQIHNSVLLYKECLNNNNVNPIVVTYFCIVCLTCLEIVGLPVSKLANMINK